VQWLVPLPKGSVTAGKVIILRQKFFKKIDSARGTLLNLSASLEPCRSRSRYRCPSYLLDVEGSSPPQVSVRGIDALWISIISISSTQNSDGP
jgi:hypothetical protein